MSLIRVRRIRKKNWVADRKRASAGKLTALLILVVVAIWYLGTI